MFAQLLIIMAIVLSTTTAPNAGAQTGYKFDFSSGEPETGYTQVKPNMGFSTEHGFGFEPGTDVYAGDGCVIGKSTYLFSVTVTLIDLCTGQFVG